MIEGDIGSCTHAISHLFTAFNFTFQGEIKNLGKGFALRNFGGKLKIRIQKSEKHSVGIFLDYHEFYKVKGKHCSVSVTHIDRFPLRKYHMPFLLKIYLFLEFQTLTFCQFTHILRSRHCDTLLGHVDLCLFVNYFF